MDSPPKFMNIVYKMKSFASIIILASLKDRKPGVYRVYMQVRCVAELDSALMVFPLFIKIYPMTRSHAWEGQGSARFILPSDECVMALEHA